ncbi:uncharacterized protein PRCAT00005522001 [Priceomyces carsonii]|uniref:uncharacterized protein n=1 Tax=Priceomyces carsonii TaxID=28549 RepID=UPI002ED91286|nr:unnamed protein product [Priceomyces carsonii]
MNSIQKINQINKKELDNNVSDSASWHFEYRDTPYIFIGNLPTNLAEKDILTIFSQYGIPTHLYLVKDKETSKSRGFCYLKYEDSRSCVLAIDNFNGIKVFNRNIKVDHVYFRLRDDQNEDDFKVDYNDVEEEINRNAIQGKQIQLLEYDKSNDNDDDDVDNDFDNIVSENNDDDEFKDPMADFLNNEAKKRKRDDDHKEHRHKHRRKHRHQHRRTDTHKSKDKPDFTNV